MNASTDFGALRPTALAQLGALPIGGSDARSFLQGQLSAEMNELRPGRALLASCNSAQGRVQAVLWLIERDSGIALILPRDLVESTAARLRRYVLRSKVTIGSAADQLGVVDASALCGAGGLDEDRAHVQKDGLSLIRLPGHSQVLTLASPSAAAPAADPGGGSAADLLWRLEHIRAGLPQVYPQTHEAFVAQMLNLDLLDGISFSKGCYTGQEIIARTHYRGAIKRRMFRFKAPCPPPQAAARILTGDQHAGDVVDSAPTDGGCELLAVISLAQLDQRLELEGARGATLERLPLPYDPLAAGY